MATITEDYVSFEIAKLLKEKGFDDIDCECHGWIGRSGKHYSVNDTFYDAEELKKAQEDRKDFIPLTTLQMAMKWLREVHHYYIQVMLDSWACGGHTGYYVVIQKTDSEFEMMLQDAVNDVFYQTYERACEAAIKYCLENLI